MEQTTEIHPEVKLVLDKALQFYHDSKFTDLEEEELFNKGGNLIARFGINSAVLFGISITTRTEPLTGTTVLEVSVLWAGENPRPEAQRQLAAWEDFAAEHGMERIQIDHGDWSGNKSWILKPAEEEEL